MNKIKHLACVMDGNRRWAKKNGLDPLLGHQEGFKILKKTVKFCLENDIKFLSLYVFSTENFKRTEKEKTYLFNLLIESAKKRLINDLIKQGVRVYCIGDRSLFPDHVKELCCDVEEKTKGGQTLRLNLLFGYGSRMEIADASRRIALDVVSGKIKAEEVTQDLFGNYLWTNGTPDPEIVVRTGGHSRMSNFLLYQAAYSELYFPDCLWPELSEHHLKEILDDYIACQLNVGK